ncbi:hypothetical protein BK133_23385 [Paenibacillus sp. FSL H8-0548]|nr:hypothetical protein BK133_23385 [Paenibacillus sp. FSL H8-0548]
MILSGCLNTDSNKPNMLQVKEVDLFAGDAKKFQPFLGAMSGAIKINYTGSKQSIRADLEIWENGVKKETLSSFMGTLISESKRGDRVFDGEFIISVKQQNEMDNANKTRFKITSAFIDQGGSISSGTEVAADLALTGSRTINFGNQAQEFSEDEEIAIWGLQASEGIMQAVDLTPEMLKRVSFAMIVKISLQDN